jgi:O-antigen/teichoic acid export membrane protein
MNWIPRRLTFDKEQINHVRAIWNFGKFTSGTQLVTSLLTNTDVFLINYFLGSASVAFYEYGRKWLEIFEVPFRSLAGVYFTEVSNMYNGKRGVEIWNFITRRALRTSMFSLLVLPVVYFLAPFLIELISSTREPSSILVFRILSLLVLFIPFDRFLGLSLDVIGFPNMNFKKGIVLLLTNFLLDIVVIKLGFGIIGVAAVSIIFYAVGTCLSFYWLRIKSIELFI